MKLWTILAAFAAGAATHFLLRERHKETEAPVMSEGATYELNHDEAVIEDTPDAAVQISAVIKESCREMDPITLRGASRLSFQCDDGQKRDFFVPGESGVYLVAGERGSLEYQGTTFISFTKESGEVVGALYHIPAEEVDEG